MPFASLLQVGPPEQPVVAAIAGRIGPATACQRWLMRLAQCVSALSFCNECDNTPIVGIDFRLRALRCGQVEEEHVRAFAPWSDRAFERSRFVEHNIGREGG